MAGNKIGIWFIGAWGGVSTAAATGLAALEKGLVPDVGLVSALPRFADLELADWADFVIGGHEIRKTSFYVEAENLYKKSRVFSHELLTDVRPRLLEFDRNVRTGTLIQADETIRSLATTATLKTCGERPSLAISRICDDLNSFRDVHALQHVIVVNVASTERPWSQDTAGKCWAELESLLRESSESPIPASTVYAAAAMQSGCSYINFTPSIGSDMPALEELALTNGVLHTGRDGKTGETLLKSVLAPMFAARNLRVMSWVGHNIFGNLDGKVLNDPANKASKVRSKDHLLGEILGHKPQTLVSIEYIESLADWKTAWDHIHFQGFLNTPMTLQLTWQGCDSLLAAPLVLDLVRFTERAWRRQQSGVMTHLSSFFKSPMGTDVCEFHKQYAMLEGWADELAGRNSE